jgi:F-type H+-transporting ATPase subunit b
MKLLAVLVLSALGLLAAEEGHGGDPLISYKWINFAIFAACIGYAIVKYLLPMLTERAAEIEKDLAVSRANVAEADSRIKNLESKLGNFEGELQSIRARVAEEREAEGKRIAQQTANLLEKLQQQRQNEILSETKLIEQQLRAFTAQRALEIAQAQLAARQDEATQHSMVAGFVKDLKQVGAR